MTATTNNSANICEVKAPAATELISAHSSRSVSSADLANCIVKWGSHFARGPEGNLYYYEKGVYLPKADDFVRSRVKQALVKLGKLHEWSSHKANEVIEFLRIDAPKLPDQPLCDILNLKNGLLDIQTRELKDHNPTFLSTVQLPIEYHPEAKCPRWEEQVKATFPPDAVDAGVAWEIIAWLMLPDTSFQKALLLVGPGGTGKSTFLSALQKFLGQQNISNLSLQKITDIRFASARLVGKLANVCTDLPNTNVNDTSTFKQLTGGDRIDAEEKCRTGFDFTPFCRLVFSANELPRIKEHSEAVSERWLILPFNTKYRGKEGMIRRSDLDTRLSDPGELSGVLVKALDALFRIREDGLTETEMMRDCRFEWWPRMDPLGDWLRKNTCRDAKEIIPKDELRKAYSEFCQANNLSVPSEVGFGRRLRRLFRHVTEVQREVNGKKKVRCWQGLRLESAHSEALAA